MICKDCGKNKINLSRSKRCCDVCLDKRIERQNRYHLAHLDSDKIRNKRLMADRKSRLLRDGMCISCGSVPINFLRSKSECSDCLDKSKVRAAIYLQANKKKVQKTQKVCMAKNPSLYKALKHKTYLNNRDDYKRYGREYRARKHKVGGTFTEKEWMELLDKYDHRCLWCGTSEKLERDHVIPISVGGNNFIGNIQPLCKYCNRKKWNKIIDFRPFGSSIMEWT